MLSARDHYPASSHQHDISYLIHAYFSSTICNMIYSDCHLHSTFSTDGSSDMEGEILHAIDLHLDTICFTEHNDYGAYKEKLFVVDAAAYHDKYLSMRDKYAGRIEILFGIEAGFQPTDHIYEYFGSYLKEWPFDFIIASSHVVDNKDPYYPVFFEDYPDDDAAYRAYFNEEYQNVLRYDDYDTYGHLDYILRYGKTKDENFSYDRFADILDPLLSELVSRGKCIEINSAGLRRGLKYPNPHIDIVKRYRELGGLPPTIGSDAHEIHDIARDFDIIEGMLKEAGFSSYSLFRGRRRHEIPLA